MAEVKTVSANEYFSNLQKTKDISTNIYNIFLINSSGTNLFNDSENSNLLAGMINAVESLAKNFTNSGMRESIFKDGKVLKLFDINNDLSLVINYDRDIKSYSEIEELMTNLTDKARNLINGQYSEVIKNFNACPNTTTLSGMREDITNIFSKYASKMKTNIFSQLKTYTDLLFKHPEANNIYPLINEIRSFEPLVKNPKDAQPLIDIASKLEALTSSNTNDNQVKSSIKIECSFLTQVLNSLELYKNMKLKK